MIGQHLEFDKGSSRPTVGLLTTKLMKKMSNLLTESLFGQTVVARGVTRK